MAEFLGQPNPRTTVPGSGSGFDAMGKPVPFYRRQAAYEHAKQMGLDAEDAFSVVDGMVTPLQKDDPYRALEVGCKYLDLTGAYRMMAVLLTAEPIRSSAVGEQTDG